MKMSQSILILTVLAVLTVACGNHQKNPVQDLAGMRAHGESEVARAEREANPPAPPERTIIVREEVPVPVESNVPTKDWFVVTPEAPVISMSEGKKTSFSVKSRILSAPDAKLVLKAVGLPEGATFAPVEAGKSDYVLTWTPAYNTVQMGKLFEHIKVTVVAELGEASAQDRKKFQGLVNKKDIDLLVSIDQTAPSGLAVEGLSARVLEGTEVPFSVVVTVPGVDDKSGVKPTLIASYDGVSMTPGNTSLELDGARHVIPDLSKNHTEYVGNFQWKYNLVFDTKNSFVQAPLSPDKKLLLDATIAKVRMNFAVVSPRGTISPKFLKQVEIRLNKEVSAPQFATKDLTAGVLALKPGQTKTAKISVSAAIARSQIKIELPNISTLVGAPTISCKVISSAKQDCTLTWVVPATAVEADLNQEIVISAIATLDGVNTDPVKYVLKTGMAKDEGVK
jgi:hypothetical protein